MSKPDKQTLIGIVIVLLMAVMAASLFLLPYALPYLKSKGDRFEPNSKAMIVRTDRDFVGISAEGAGSRLTPDTVYVPPGTMVLIEKDDHEPISMKIDGLDTVIRRVEVLVIEGEYRGVSGTIDADNLRVIPD